MISAIGAVPVGWVGLAGCVAAPRHSTQTTPMTSLTQPSVDSSVKPAILIQEARLPRDFPSTALVGQVVTKDYPRHRLARRRSAPSDLAASPDGVSLLLFDHIRPMTST